MKKTSVILGSLFGLFSFTALGQNPNDQILKINDSIYKVSDFERLYTKNLDVITDKKQKDISNYLDLYVLYKLKLQKAYELKLNEKPSFQDELKMHRNQLAEKYFINEDKLNQLIEEAVERSKYEVHAAHILIKVDEYASAKDSLNAYNKALEIRDKVISGLPFAEAAKTYSDDLSAQQNNGDLGYFNVFRMVYPFETGAYNTPVGEISLPVRSQFGYHLIKVLDKRLQPKPREVSHIYFQKYDDNTTIESVYARASAVHEKLKNGSDFGEMAVEFSDDAAGRGAHGAMGKFYEHNLDIPNVGEKVYALKEGEFTEPIQSNYGFHIFKVDKFLPEPSDDQLKFEYTRKVKSDSRSQILEKDLADYLTKEYQVKINTKNLSSVKQLVNESIYSDERWKEKALKKSDLIIFTYDQDKQSVKGTEYITWLNNQKEKYAKYETFSSIANASFEQFQKEILKKHYDKNLSVKHPDFAQIVQEYKDGLLLFELLEGDIWNVAKNDTLGLQNHYEKNQLSYKKPASFKGNTYVFSNKSDAKKWYKELSKNPEYVFPASTYVEAVQKEISLTDEKSDPFTGLKLSEIKDGVITKDKKYIVFVKPSITPSYVPKYDEVKKQVISEYTQEFENKYYDILKAKSNVEVNEEVLSQLKKKYSNK